MLLIDSVVRELFEAVEPASCVVELSKPCRDMVEFLLGAWEASVPFGVASVSLVTANVDVEFTVVDHSPVVF